MIKLRHEKEMEAEFILLPTAFITNYLSVLSGPSLKLYLRLCYLIQSSQKQLDEERLALSLSLSQEQLADAITELNRRGLISLSEAGLEILDIRSEQPAEMVETAFEATETQSQAASDQLSQREAFIAQISNTFYQGAMPMSFYYKIEDWLDRYKFEPEVVYALFNELKHYQTLHSDSYASAIANRWAEQGIRNFSDLSVLYEYENGFNRSVRQLQKNLRQEQNFSSYQLDFLRRWFLDWQLSFELVDEAFRRAAAQSRQHNFPYVEGILRQWKDAGVRTTDQVLELEAKRRKKAPQRSGLRQARPQNQANFSQRDYDPEFYEQFDSSMDLLDSDKDTQS
ncbi:MAG: DnaD domain protein [Eubacteriales bacterium]|nr:DnaD domain protein [Eubacteriales bacterium]